MKLLRPLIFISLLLSSGWAFGDAAHFSGGSTIIGKHLSIFEDKTSELTAQEVLRLNKFQQNEKDAPNMNLSQSTFWVKFSIQNDSPESELFLEIAHPFIHDAQLFSINEKNVRPLKNFEENESFDARPIKHQNLVFTLDIAPKQTTVYLLRVKSFNQMILPLILRDQESFNKVSQLNETINGIFSGIILVMVLYNIFIYFSIRDRSYLFYVLYVLFVGLAQTSLSGYAFKYLWPLQPGFNQVATIWFSGISGVCAMFFVKNFLQLEEKWVTGVRIVHVIIALYSSAIILSITGFHMLSFRAVDISGIVGAVGLSVIGVRLSFQGYRPAKLFLLAWTLFLMGLAMMVLRNFNILPYNTLTNYTMQFGSILEIVLLSIALADKINILKKEKELSQEQALRISLENEKIIMEQNTVRARTVFCSIMIFSFSSEMRRSLWSKTRSWNAMCLSVPQN